MKLLLERKLNLDRVGFNHEVLKMLKQNHIRLNILLNAVHVFISFLESTTISYNSPPNHSSPPTLKSKQPHRQPPSKHKHPSPLATHRLSSSTPFNTRHTRSHSPETRCRTRTVNKHTTRHPTRNRNRRREPSWDTRRCNRGTLRLRCS